MSREIPLTQGYVALVDDEDYEWLIGIPWSASDARGKVYARSKTAIPERRMHRLIAGAVKGQQVDHKDGNPLNNQRSNLRIVTHAQNSLNKRSVSKSTGYKGVTLAKHRNGKSIYWRADIRLKDQRLCLGQFRSPLDAARAYDRAAIELHGEYACTNAMLGKL